MLVNLSDRLFSLKIESEQLNSNQSIVVRYVGSCRNDGTLLSPEQVCYMLQQVSGQELHLVHAHRQQIMLINPQGT